MITTLLLTLFLAFCAYKWFTPSYRTYEKRGIKFFPPTSFAEKVKKFVVRKKSDKTMTEALIGMYNYFSSEKFFGLSGILEEPMLMIRDPELIKQLTVKDFDYFVDHIIEIREDQDPLFGRNLLNSRGKKWKDLRATVSPAFTGSKIRIMQQFVTEYAREALKYLEEISEGGESLTLDSDDFFKRYSNGVIATCTFGMKIDCLRDRDNAFHLQAQKLLKHKSAHNLKYKFMRKYPELFKLLGITLLSKETIDFYRRIVWDEINFREKENKVRPDMIHLLMEARKGKLNYEDAVQENEGYAVVKESHIGEVMQEITEDDITAQCLTFFLVGANSTNKLMCFMAHELAVHPEIQETLLAEVDATTEKLNGQPLTYEALQDMEYLDMVISETLRYWPGNFTHRVCVKPYKMEVDGKTYDIKPGEAIIIPMVCLHRDSNYFPDPSRFDPERFNRENKHNIKPFTYLPFGVGPRNCVGSRFALMETKVIFYYILTKFTFEVSVKTQVPLKLRKNTFYLVPEKGFWIDLKARK